MNFNKHSNLEGQHAFLGASKYHWLNYNDDKLVETFSNLRAAQKVPKSQKTLNEYVNDAIGYRMHPEQVLYFSEWCFGTADAISFRNNFLRIHDLKTGKERAHIEQLRIYAALFCLEYRVSPADIKIELRIYQSDEVIIDEPDASVIVPIMDKIITFSKIITKLAMEEDL